MFCPFQSLPEPQIPRHLLFPELLTPVMTGKSSQIPAPFGTSTTEYHMDIWIGSSGLFSMDGKWMVNGGLGSQGLSSSLDGKLSEVSIV